MDPGGICNETTGGAANAPYSRSPLAPQHRLWSGVLSLSVCKSRRVGVFRLRATFLVAATKLRH